MSLFKRGAAIFLLITALAISFSGCIDNTPAVVTPAPGAQAIPLPLPGSYMQNYTITAAKIANGTISNANIGTNVINDTQLASNALPYNVSANSTTGTFTGVTFAPILNNGSITVNRTSFVVVQWNGEVGITRVSGDTNSSYMYIQLGGVNMTNSPVVVATNSSYLTTLSGTRTVLVYNASVTAGTYTIVPYINGSNAGSIVSIGRNVLITTAYPHS